MWNNFLFYKKFPDLRKQFKNANDFQHQALNEFQMKRKNGKDSIAQKTFFFHLTHNKILFPTMTLQFLDSIFYFSDQFPSNSFSIASTFIFQCHSTQSTLSKGLLFYLSNLFSRHLGSFLCK